MALAQNHVPNRVGVRTVAESALTRGSGFGVKVRRPIPITVVIDIACAVCGVSFGEVAGRGRHWRVSATRGLIVLAARTWTMCSFPEIARAMHRPNHSTVITAMDRLRRQLDPHGGRRLRDDEGRFETFRRWHHEIDVRLSRLAGAATPIGECACGRFTNYRVRGEWKCRVCLYDPAEAA